MKQACAFQSNVRVTLSEKTADMKRIFALMALGAKQGNTLTIQVEGADEEQPATKPKLNYNISTNKPSPKQMQTVQPFLIFIK